MSPLGPPILGRAGWGKPKVKPIHMYQQRGHVRVCSHPQKAPEAKDKLEVTESLNVTSKNLAEKLPLFRLRPSYLLRPSEFLP